MRPEEEGRQVQMSTTPPEQPPGAAPGPPPAQPRPATGWTPGTMMASGARMPIPGNAELLVWLIVWIVLAILWAATDGVDAGLFATLTTVLTLGYLVSRGIAKAS